MMTAAFIMIDISFDVAIRVPNMFPMIIYGQHNLTQRAASYNVLYIVTFKHAPVQAGNDPHTANKRLHCKNKITLKPVMV